MVKNVLIALLSLFIQNTILAQDKDADSFYNGFSGGMYLHGGYMKSNQFTATFPSSSQQLQIKDPTFGIGGRLSFHFNQHLLVGSEGYSSNIRYGEFDNTYSLGWGGLLVDYYTLTPKYMFSIGFSFGGGKITHYLFNTEGNKDFVADDIIKRSYNSILMVPHIGIDVFLTPKVALSLKLDNIFYLSDYQNKDLSKGLRLYAGIIFHKH